MPKHFHSIPSNVAPDATGRLTRRDLLAGAAGLAAIALPTIVPARALGLEPGVAAASERHRHLALGPCRAP